MTVPDSVADHRPAHRMTVVLVVEDEVLVRFALADYLRESGLRVFEARCAEEAMQLISFYKGEIDVVFCDVWLPGAINGIELAGWVKRHRAELPVVLTSGDTRVAPDALRAAPFLRKPYDLKAVLVLLEQTAHRPPPQPGVA